MRQHSVTSGFSLLELSVVLVILGIVIGGIMAVLTQDTRRVKQAELIMKMDAIEKALLNFRITNNRLPCPADGARAISVAQFGIESATPGTCTGGTPAANYTGTAMVGGTVPTKALGLPDEMMFDPWGGRFSYAVTTAMTATNAFVNDPITSTVGNITVNDSAGASRTTRGIVVVFSNGQNGHGAYQLSGVRKNAGSSNAAEQTNCNCDATAVTAGADNIFVQKATSSSAADLSDSFDDVLRYYTRENLLSPHEAAANN